MRTRDRWPDPIGEEYVSVPVALWRHQRALKLDDGDVRLLEALEHFRRGDGASPVYPSQETLADLCAVSVDTIERRVRKLREHGYLEVERRAIKSGKRVNHYTRRGLDQALRELEVARLEQEANPAAVRGSQEGGDPAAVRGSATANPAPMRATNPAAMRVTNPAPMRGEVETGETEAGKHTQPRARELALEVLRVFNELASTKFSGEGHVRQIEAVVAARGDLTLEDHRGVIERNLRAPWWSGPPSPAVIYKSLEQFERALHCDRRSDDERDESDRALARVSRAKPRPPRPKPWDGALRGVIGQAGGSA